MRQTKKTRITSFNDEKHLVLTTNHNIHSLSLFVLYSLSLSSSSFSLFCIQTKKMMMFVAILLLILLFLFGFLHTVLHPEAKKLVSQSSLVKVFSQQHVVAGPSRAGDNKEVKRNGTHEKTDLKNVFATFDKNKDGFIAKQELRESMRNVGVELSETEAAEMVEKVDSNGDGLIDFDEFCELFESMVGGDRAAGWGGGEEGDGGGGEGDLKEAFDVFDGDRDGLISVEELGLVLSSLGMKEGERLENCKEMIRKVDVDGDGMVNFDEFKKMMKVSGGRLISVS